MKALIESSMMIDNETETLAVLIIQDKDRVHVQCTMVGVRTFVYVRRRLLVADVSVPTLKLCTR